MPGRVRDTRREWRWGLLLKCDQGGSSDEVHTPEVGGWKSEVGG